MRHWVNGKKGAEQCAHTQAATLLRSCCILRSAEWMCMCVCVRECKRVRNEWGEKTKMRKTETERNMRNTPTTLIRQNWLRIRANRMSTQQHQPAYGLTPNSRTWAEGSKEVRVEFVSCSVWFWSLPLSFVFLRSLRAFLFNRTSNEFEHIESYTNYSVSENTHKVSNNVLNLEVFRSLNDSSEGNFSISHLIFKQFYFPITASVFEATRRTKAKVDCVLR